jgi:hypothetical protein
MTPNALYIGRPVADAGIEQDDTEVLLGDRARVAYEFAAIMNTSGFGDRVIATTMDPGPPRARSGVWRHRLTGGLPLTEPAAGVIQRVRSPPSNGSNGRTV